MVREARHHRSTVPLGFPAAVIFSLLLLLVGWSHTLNVFLPSQAWPLLADQAPPKLSTVSPRFSPPVCYQLSLAGGSSLLWIHLNPAPHRLTSCFHLFGLPIVIGGYWASLVKSACLNLNPSVITRRVIQLSGFPTPSKVTHPECQLRFACAFVPDSPLGFLQTPPLPVTPLPIGCLPAGWVTGFLSTHWLGRHARRTKKRCPDRASF